MRHSRCVLAAGLWCALAAGCGGGYDSPSAPSGGGGQPPPAGGGGSSAITIMGDRGAQSFNPNPATADSVRNVSWRNSDGAVHRIVANDGSFDTGDIAPGATSRTITLATDGANYHCSLHPGMIGAINASAGPPPPCTGQYC